MFVGSQLYRFQEEIAIITGKDIKGIQETLEM